jgi:hypothetical protein
LVWELPDGICFLGRNSPREPKKNRTQVKFKKPLPQTEKFADGISKKKSRTSGVSRNFWNFFMNIQDILGIL